MIRHIEPSLEHMTCKRSRNGVFSVKVRGFKPFYWKKMINIQRRKARSHHARTKRVGA
jgi:hypothetical protein